MDGEDIERMLDLVGMDYDEEHQHEQHESELQTSNSFGLAQTMILTSSSQSIPASNGLGEQSSSSNLEKNNSNNNSLLNNNATINTATSDSSRTKDIFYGENYFDLDDILAQNQRINVKFLRTIPQLGFLDPSLGSDEADIEKGSKLELPLWAVKELISEPGAIQVTLPVGYNHEYREIFLADANCVNLSKYGPNYFRVGQHLSKMNLPESEDIAHSMIDTYTQRSHRLVNFALSGNSTGSDNNVITKAKPNSKLMEKLHGKKLTSAGEDTTTEMAAFVAALDNWEKELLKLGK